MFLRMTLHLHLEQSLGMWPSLWGKRLGPTPMSTSCLLPLKGAMTAPQGLSLKMCTGVDVQCTCVCTRVRAYVSQSVQSLSHVRHFATPWITARQASLSITNSRSLPNSFPLSRWCHLTISSSVVPFFSCLQSFPASGAFHMSQLVASGGQNIGVSASTSALPMNTQDWFPLGWTGWISLHLRDSQESSPTPQFKSVNSSALSFLYSPTLTSIHDHWKNHSLD